MNNYVINGFANDEITEVIKNSMSLTVLLLFICIVTVLILFIILLL